MTVSPADRTVLIIEDIPSIAKLFSILLKKLDLDVVVFENGEDACEWLESHTPVLVLSDIMLPGLSGEEVLRRIRSMNHNETIPVIAVTALALEGDKDRLLESGFTDYISKPVVAPAFLEQIKKYVAQ